MRVPYFSIFLKLCFCLELKSASASVCSFKLTLSQGFFALEETPGESRLSGFSLILTGTFEYHGGNENMAS